VIYTGGVGHAVKALRYKVAGSIPGGVTEIFIELILSVTLGPWSRLNL
jgi:hypothetical protein